MIRLTLAMVAAATGELVAGVGHLLAQASAPQPSDVSTWVSAGGTTMAVGGLVYIARLLASGHLVAFPVEKLQEASLEREAKLADLAKRSTERERVLERILLGGRAGGEGDGA